MADDGHDPDPDPDAIQRYNMAGARREGGGGADAIAWNDAPDKAKDQANDTAGEGDMMAIGEQCSFAGCGRLDFLPYKCGNCSTT